MLKSAYPHQLFQKKTIDKLYAKEKLDIVVKAFGVREQSQQEQNKDQSTDSDPGIDNSQVAILKISIIIIEKTSIIMKLQRIRPNVQNAISQAYQRKSCQIKAFIQLHIISSA